MITQILIFLTGVLVGLYSAWFLGGRGIENLQDWWTYDYCKKYKIRK